MLRRLHFETKEEWLSERAQQGFGGSDAAAIAGFSKWKNSATLYREKLGMDKPKDISTNESVQRGVLFEHPLRELFKAEHNGEIEVLHFPYDMLFQEERPWLFATLDGECERISDNKKGILEIKTCACTRKTDWEDWRDQIPQGYFCQILHQFAATGFDFAYMYACLISMNGNKTIKEYYFEREDYFEDIDYLICLEESAYMKLKSFQPPSAMLSI